MTAIELEHPDQGRLMAWLDGELAHEDALRVREHVSACPPCRDASQSLRQERALLSDAIGRIDPEAPAGRVRRELEHRIARTRSGGADGGRRRRVLPRAAAVALLIVAGGAAAAVVPGSPLRRWLAGPESEAAPAVTGSRRASDEESALRVAASDGAIRVSLIGLPEDAEILVSIVDGEQAGLVTAAETPFRTGAGWLEATVATGPVRVEMPRGVPSVSLEVDGRMILSLRSGRLDVAPDSLDRLGTELRFRVR